MGRACHFGRKRLGNRVLFCIVRSARVLPRTAPSAAERPRAPISPESLAATFLSLEKKGASNINLVTGAHYVPQIIHSLDIARAEGLTIPVVYNSSGYECAETLRMLEGYVDIYLPDYKYYSSYYAALYSHAEDYRDFAVPAIDEMVRQTGAPRSTSTVC